MQLLGASLGVPRSRGLRPWRRRGPEILGDQSRGVVGRADDAGRGARQQRRESLQLGLHVLLRQRGARPAAHAGAAEGAAAAELVAAQRQRDGLGEGRDLQRCEPGGALRCRPKMMSIYVYLIYLIYLII